MAKRQAQVEWGGLRHIILLSPQRKTSDLSLHLRKQRGKQTWSVARDGFNQDEQFTSRKDAVSHFNSIVTSWSAENNRKVSNIELAK